MKTIVVGYDGSPAAENALSRAEELAQAFQARVVVATVVRPSAPVAAVVPVGPVLFAPLDAYPIDTDPTPADGTPPPWDRQLQAIRERLEGKGIRAEATSAVGLPIDELVEVADEYEADLIVVGTHEPGLLERIFAGSVSQGVARRAHCDVLVVHPKDERRNA